MALDLAVLAGPILIGLLAAWLAGWHRDEKSEVTYLGPRSDRFDRLIERAQRDHQRIVIARKRRKGRFKG